MPASDDKQQAKTLRTSGKARSEIRSRQSFAPVFDNASLLLSTVAAALIGYWFRGFDGAFVALAIWLYVGTGLTLIYRRFIIAVPFLNNRRS